MAIKTFDNNFIASSLARKMEKIYSCHGKDRKGIWKSVLSKGVCFIWWNAK